MENKDKKVTSTKPAAESKDAVVKPAEKAADAAKEMKPAEKAASVVKEAKPAEKAAAVVKEAKSAEKVETEKKKEAKPDVKEASAKKSKPGRKPGKTVAKKKPAEKVEEVYVQFQELEITTNEIIDKAKQIYIAEGHRESSIKSLRLYIKPDERMAYYVINEKMTGGIEL